MIVLIRNCLGRINTDKLKFDTILLKVTLADKTKYIFIVLILFSGDNLNLSHISSSK